MIQIEIKITDERIQEVCDCLNTFYKTIITPEKLEPVLNECKDLCLIQEIIEGSYSDTAPRSQLIDAVVYSYLGEGFDLWPSNITPREYSERFRNAAVKAGLLPAEDKDKLEQIREVMRTYHRRLTAGERGEILKVEAVHEIENILEMRWKG